MLAATKVKLRGSEKKEANWNTYDISCIKRVDRKFHVVVVKNSGKEMYTKSAMHQLMFFCFCFICFSGFFAVLVAVAV